jgi:hypothetical protein
LVGYNIFISYTNNNNYYNYNNNNDNNNNNNGYCVEVILILKEWIKAVVRNGNNNLKINVKN